MTVDGWQAMGDVAPTFEVGAAVTGSVHVWVDEPVRCDGLDVQLEPVSTRRGYGVGPAQPPVRLFQGQWEAGEYDYRFSAPSPWPPTYSGKHVGWKWVARARADIPWAIDPEGTGEFRLVLNEPATALEITPLAESTSSPHPGWWSRALQGLLLLALISIAAGLLGSYLELASEELTDNLTGASVVLLVICLVTLGGLSSGQTTSGSIEQLGITQRQGGEGYRSGGAASIECEVTPRAGARVAAMSAQLLVSEYVEWTTNKNEHSQTHRYEHVFHRGDAALAEDPEAKCWRGSLRLPELSGVPCFSFGHPPGRGIVWKVEVSTTLRGKTKPELSRRFLNVRPRLS